MFRATLIQDSSHISKYFPQSGISYPEKRGNNMTPKMVTAQRVFIIIGAGMLIIGFLVPISTWSLAGVITGLVLFLIGSTMKVIIQVFKLSREPLKRLLTIIKHILQFGGLIAFGVGFSNPSVLGDVLWIGLAAFFIGMVWECIQQSRYRGAGTDI